MPLDAISTLYSWEKCKWCGKEFQKKWSDPPYCSERCEREAKGGSGGGTTIVQMDPETARIQAEAAREKREAEKQMREEARAQQEANEKNPAWWIKQIASSSEEFKKVPPNLKTEDFCKSALDANYKAFEYFPDNMKTPELCLAAVQKSEWMLEHVPLKLKTEALCLVAVNAGGHALEYVPQKLKTEAVCRAAVNQSGDALEYVPQELRTEALCVAAVNQNKMISRLVLNNYVPPHLKDQVMKAAGVKPSKVKYVIIGLVVFTVLSIVLGGIIFMALLKG